MKPPRICLELNSLYIIKNITEKLPQASSVSSGAGWQLPVNNI